MNELEMIVKEEKFEVSTQFCDSDDCHHDCNHGSYCDAYITDLF